MIWFIPLAMAAAGAMMDKEKPLRGAALGAAAGLTGGAALGAMGAGAAGAGAAGAAGAGAAGAGTAGTAGLLGAEAAGAGAGAAGTGLLGAGTGTTQAGMLAAQEAGLGASSLGWGGATTGVQGTMNGLLGAEAGASAGGLLSQADKIAKPVGTAMQVSQSMQEPDQPLPPPPQLQRTPMNLNETIAQGDMRRQYEDAEQQRRRQLMAMYAGNIGRMG